VLTVNQKRELEAINLVERKREEFGTMSWETMSEGGNPFRNPADGNSHPQDSDSKYEEMLNHMKFSEWERILDVASHDRSFDPPPKMIVFTPPTSPRSSARKNPTSLTDNRYGQSQSQRQWYEDDESPSDVNRWSPKRLMCGMQDNEVVRVAPEFSTKPSPPKREVRQHSGLHSFSSQDQRKTSPYCKIHSQERLDHSGRSLPLGFLSHSMNLWREEKTAKPVRNVSRREWYERSDSMKGKAVSNSRHFMQMVFFDKVGEEPPEEDGGQSCSD
jgi:hypothetical protein